MDTYNFDVRPLRLAAADWFEDKIHEGRLAYELSARGNCKQFVVSPGLCRVQKLFYHTGNSAQDEYFITYQVEIKTVKGKGTAVMKITCHQAPDMPAVLRNFYIDTLLPVLGRVYRKNGSWYDKQINSIKITQVTEIKEIREFLETGLSRAEYFEKILLNKIENAM